MKTRHYVAIGLTALATAGIGYLGKQILDIHNQDQAIIQETTQCNYASGHPDGEKLRELSKRNALVLEQKEKNLIGRLLRWL